MLAPFENAKHCICFPKFWQFSLQTQALLLTCYSSYGTMFALSNFKETVQTSHDL